MPFPARFAGCCCKCNAAIEIGQFITWSRRERGKASHADCSNPSAVPDKPVDANAAMLATMQQMIEMLQGGAAMPPVASPEAALAPPPAPALVTPVKPVERKRRGTLRPNAPWHEVLRALCDEFKGELLRILLIGPPGTGKSKTSLLLSGTPYRVTMSEGMGVEDLIGMYQLVKGETVWIDGPLIRAMREGVKILVDEIDHHASEVGSIMYGFLDDAPHMMLPTGETVHAAKGFGVIGTTNSNVTSLPDAVLDRFEAIIPATEPHPDALEQFPTVQRAAVSNYFAHAEKTAWAWSGKPTLRRMAAFRRMEPVIGEVNAAQMAFGNAGKEILSVMATAAR